MLVSHALERGIDPPPCLNASLSMLRAGPGEPGSGAVRPIDATEDQVVSVYLPWMCYPEELTAEPRPTPHTSGSIPAKNIHKLIDGLEPGHHQDNIKEHRPHVMVMSTGRCGTMSLHKLLQGSNLESYHVYWWMNASFTKWEMMCRLYAGNFDSLHPMAEWAACRAAEWSGDKPMIGLNHTDTVFAPVFAAIHPKSKFVYLRRDPEKVFKSFYSKDQYGDGWTCFRTLKYNFDNGFQFSVPEQDEKEAIWDHIRQTEEFSRTFGEIMGDRWIEISADKLFSQDTDEIARLLDFTGSDIPLDNAVEHFKTPTNVKAHKVCRSL
jgi:hypothetical protein